MEQYVCAMEKEKRYLCRTAFLYIKDAAGTTEQTRIPIYSVPNIGLFY